MVRTAPVLLLVAALAATALSAPEHRQTLDLERLSDYSLQLEKLGKLPPIDHIVRVIECAGNEADPAVDMVKAALQNTGEFVASVKTLKAKFDACKSDIFCELPLLASGEKLLTAAKEEVAETLATAKVIAIKYNDCLNGTVTPSS